MDIQTILGELDLLYENGDSRTTEHFLRNTVNRARQEGDWQTCLTIQNEQIGFYRVMGDFDEGENIFLECLRLLQDHDQEGTLAYATTLLNGANLYRGAGKIAQAEAIFHQVYSIYRVILPENDLRLAGFFNNLGLIQREQGKEPDALASLKKGLSILRLHKNTEAEQATAHGNIADGLIRLGQYSEAEEELLQCEAVYRNMTNKGPHYASFLNTRGILYQQMCQKEKAAEYFQMGMDWIEKYYGKNPFYRVMERNLQLLTNSGEETT